MKDKQKIKEEVLIEWKWKGVIPNNTALQKNVIYYGKIIDIAIQKTAKAIFEDFPQMKTISGKTVYGKVSGERVAEINQKWCGDDSE